MATGLIDVGIIKPELAGSFAAGYRGAEQSRQQLAQEKQQTELGQMKLEQLKQDRASLLQLQDSLKAAGKDPDPIKVFDALIATGNPDYVMKGIDGKRRLTELQRADSMLRQYAPELFGAEPANALAPAGAPAPAPVNAMAPAAPTVGPAAPVNAMAPAAAPNVAPGAGADVNALRRQLMVLSSIDDPRAKAMADVIKGQITEASRPHVVGGRLVTGAGKELYAAPEKPPAMVAEYTFAKTPEGGGFRGTYQEFVTARAAAGRAPAQPVAPTITQIVDPANPNQMITVDARRYTGGTVGSPGVLGVGGKEPGAAVRKNKAEEGKTQLADDLDNLRASFTRLDEMRAIPSTGRGALSNIASATAATGIGQTVGRFVGTEPQVEREVINSARTRLVNSIKNATGMSAQQLNSNVELQTMLKSISDPGQPIEAALRIIDDIEDAYVKGTGMSKKNPPGVGAKPAPAGSKPSVAPPAGFTVD